MDGCMYHRKQISAMQKENENIHADSINSSMIDTARFAQMVFDSANYQLGIVRRSEIRETEIWFTNQGNIPLVIDQMTSCECTTLDYTRKPVMPGARSSIKVRYDSKDKSGPQIIDIDILANTESGTASVKLYLSVE